jgi:hypothetical protein
MCVEQVNQRRSSTGAGHYVKKIKKNILERYGRKQYKGSSV